MVSYHSVSLSDLSIPNSSLFLCPQTLTLSLFSFSHSLPFLSFSPDEDQRTDRKFANLIFTCCYIWSNTSIMPHLQQSNFHSNGLTWPILIRLSLNSVQRSLITFQTAIECLKWLRPFFDLPARPTKIDQK